MKIRDFISEDIVTDAHDMHRDHEVQMAREELYHSAENAIVLHKLLKHVSEQQGLEGWVSEKITLANDYLKTVREYLEYELMTGNPTQVSAEMSVAESASAGASSAGAVATVVKGGKAGTNLLGGPVYKGKNPFKKMVKK